MVSETKKRNEYQRDFNDKEKRKKRWNRLTQFMTRLIF